MNRKTAVIGVALRVPVTDETECLEELQYQITQDVLRDAGIEIDDIDGIVVASNDQFDGRAISIMAASGSVGGVDRDILSTPSAGEHAFVMGVLRVASGQYETQLVLSWSPTEASSLSEAQRLGADPYYHRALPLDEDNAAALQASALAAKDASIVGLAESLAKQNLSNGQKCQESSRSGARRSPSWPLTSDMTPPPVTGLVAIVLASEDFVAARGLKDVAWLNGMGWATESGFLGDRDLTTAPALTEAVARAYEEAGITDPSNEFDLVELTGTTPYQEILAARTLKFSDADLSSSEKINRSGGVSTLNPVFCTGMIRIAEAANQIRGRAGKHQLKGARRAVAHAASGFAMMYQSVLVFGKEPMGEKA